MQLLALTRQSTAGINSSQHQQVKSRSPAQPLLQVHSHSMGTLNPTIPYHSHSHADTKAVVHDRKMDATLAHDDREGASLLDTPAPRRRPPVPTVYESTTGTYQPNRSAHYPKTSPTQSGVHYCLICG